MRFTSYSALALGALSFAAAEYEVERAAPKPRASQCGAPHPDDGYLELSQAMYESNGTYLADNFVMAAADDSIAVQIYWHVVAGAKTLKEGWVSDQDIAGQLAVINKAYAPHKMSFKTAAISRNVNATWTWRPSEAAKNDMTKALRKGTYADLNVYIQKGVGEQGVAGLCYLPSKGVSKNKPPSYDGCYINSDTLPAAGPSGFTAVHELGHWMGLPHTFSSSCADTKNDLIADTPTHINGPVDGNNCNKKYDSCPGQPGNDPVHNYMSYFPESCKSEFTKGQETRMREMWYSARNAA